METLGQIKQTDMTRGNPKTESPSRKRHLEKTVSPLLSQFKNTMCRMPSPRTSRPKTGPESPLYQLPNGTRVGFPWPSGPRTPSPATPESDSESPNPGPHFQDTTRVRLTDVNPHLVCVLCHGYFVDATTITECLHSFCRSCIFRHLEVKSYCPICEVQVHTRLHRSLKPDKTLQDIVYKLVPGLFHSEMERRREFYKSHPFRDEHLEPESRGIPVDRLIYSPSDTISISLEFYDTEREREEWAAPGFPSPSKVKEQDKEMCPTKETNVKSSKSIPHLVNHNNNNNKRYLQCPAVFKMAHLKKFLRQKYNLPSTSNVEIIYKRESLPDSYSLMDVAYIYTWKRNGPMRFYYRIPDVVEILKPKEDSIQEVIGTSETTKGEDSTKIELNHVENKSNEQPKEDSPKEITGITHKEEVNGDVCSKDSPVLQSAMAERHCAKTKGEEVEEDRSGSESFKEACVKQVDGKKNPDSTSVNGPAKVEGGSETTKPLIPKQDELPVSVLLSLGKCRLGVANGVANPELKSKVTKSIKAGEQKHRSLNGRVSVNKIAQELHLKAVDQQKVNKSLTSNPVNTRPLPDGSKPTCTSPSANSRTAGAKPKKTGSPHHNSAHSNQGKLTQDIGVMDQRIQQLYRNQCNQAANQLNQGQKQESRLASWLNSRFQTKSSDQVPTPNVAHSALTNSINNLVASHKNPTYSLTQKSNILNVPSRGENGNFITTAASLKQQKGKSKKDYDGLGSNKVNGFGPTSGTHGFVGNHSPAPGMLPTSNFIKLDHSGWTKISPNHSVGRVSSASKLSSGNSNSVTEKSNNSAIPKVPVFNKEASSLTNGMVNNKYLVQQTTNNSSNDIKDKSGGSNENTETTCPATNGAESPTPANNNDSQEGDISKKDPDRTSGSSVKLDEEVMNLKKKLEELRKLNDPKGREVGGCQITHENPDPDEVKKRRDLVPVVSIELMRGGKRPVPGLKAIQEIVELGKRKSEEKRDQDKKLKLSTGKETKCDEKEAGALDLSRCGPTSHPAKVHHWLNPLLQPHYLPSTK